MAQNSSKSANPRKRGRGKPFQKGKSGNPGGRPKGHGDFRKVVEAYLESKLNPKTTVLQDCLDRIRTEKPEILLHYAYGKPVELVDVHSTSTVVGLPDDILAGLRAYAKTL